jgi:hypothetical protein
MKVISVAYVEYLVLSGASVTFPQFLDRRNELGNKQFAIVTGVGQADRGHVRVDLGSVWYPRLQTAV